MLTVEVAGPASPPSAPTPGPPTRPASYTSLFVFVALSYPLGGPPCLFVTGLGGGAGYNRRLIPPQTSPTCPASRSSPPSTTRAQRTTRWARSPRSARAMPPERGSLWLAAGRALHARSRSSRPPPSPTSRSTAASRSACSASRRDGAARRTTRPLVSVELALKARFSAPRRGALGPGAAHRQLVAAQPRLPAHRRLRLLHVVPRGQFVLTLGGYHPSFQQARPSSPSCRGSASTGRSTTALVDQGRGVLRADQHVRDGGRPARGVVRSRRRCGPGSSPTPTSSSPGTRSTTTSTSASRSAAGFTAKICFFACVPDRRISVSLGASVHLVGPPLHGSVGIDYWVLEPHHPVRQRAARPARR